MFASISLIFPKPASPLAICSTKPLACFIAALKLVCASASLQSSTISFMAVQKDSAWSLALAVGSFNKLNSLVCLYRLNASWYPSNAALRELLASAARW